MKEGEGGGGGGCDDRSAIPNLECPRYLDSIRIKGNLVIPLSSLIPFTVHLH